MWRYVAGGVATLLLAVAGIVLLNARAKPGTALAALPAVQAQVEGSAEPLPDTVPEASDRTREEKRFDRYDKDRNGAVTRDEYLMQRRKAFAKLDTTTTGRCRSMNGRSRRRPSSPPPTATNRAR